MQKSTAAVLSRPHTAETSRIVMLRLPSDVSEALRIAASAMGKTQGVLAAELLGSALSSMAFWEDEVDFGTRRGEEQESLRFPATAG